MITTSIVLYNTNESQLKAVLDCTIAANSVSKIYLMDNSPNDNLKKFADYSQLIDYTFNNANLGYGAAHNIALHKAIELGAEYHVVLNPDICFGKDTFVQLNNFMNYNHDCVYVLPKVTYPDGSLQYLCKLLPTPSDLIFRRFIPSVGLFKNWKERKNDRYTLKSSGYNRIINPPCLSGCFMFIRTSALKENNIFFDDSFFMYFEDFDLIRRLHRVGRTLFYPEVSIIHDHAQESYHSKKMLKQHIKSAIHYFNKYGWFFDKERQKMNKQILQEIKQWKIVI